MRASRAVASTALGACAACVALVVHAQPATNDEARVSLAWRAPAGCPDEASVRADVVRLLAGSQEPVIARADVERVGDSWRVVVAMNGGERRLEAGSCRAIAEATALIVAMAVDPARVAANRASLVVDASAPTSLHEDASIESNDAGAVEAAMPNDAALVTPTEDAARSSTASAPPRAAAPATHPTRATLASSQDTAFAISASGAIALGALPAAAVGAAVAFAWTPAPLRFELTGAYFFPDSTRLGAFTGALSNTVERFTMLSAAARACYLARTDDFDVGPCLEVEAASVHGEGLGIANPSGGKSGWIAPGAEFFGAWRVARSWAVVFRADALIPTTRPDFQVNGATLHRPAFLTGRFALGAELRF